MNDKLQVSKGGLISLADAVNYCGTGKTAVESTSNRIVIALRSGTSSKGGKFKCTLTSKLLPVSCNCGKRRMVKKCGNSAFSLPLTQSQFDNQNDSILCIDENSWGYRSTNK